MSNSKAVFPSLLGKENIVREIQKALTGKDPGPLEHVLTCSAIKAPPDICLNVDYAAFEDEHHNMITIGHFITPMRPVGYTKFLDAVTTGYMEAKYGHCPWMLNRTVIALIHDPYFIPEWEPCKDNQYIIFMGTYQENPAIAEMSAVLLDDKHNPVTALGKAVQEHLVDIWGEKYWE